MRSVDVEFIPGDTSERIYNVQLFRSDQQNGLVEEKEVNTSDSSIVSLRLVTCLLIANKIDRC